MMLYDIYLWRNKCLECQSKFFLYHQTLVIVQIFLRVSLADYFQSAKLIFSPCFQVGEDLAQNFGLLRNLSSFRNFALIFIGLIKYNLAMQTRGRKNQKVRRWSILTCDSFEALQAFFSLWNCVHFPRIISLQRPNGFFPRIYAAI